MPMRAKSQASFVAIGDAQLRPVRSSPDGTEHLQIIPTFFAAHILESPGEIPAEVAFLQQVWRRHRKSPVHRLLDIACGDSPTDGCWPAMDSRWSGSIVRAP